MSRIRFLPVALLALVLISTGVLTASAQDATPAASPAASPVTTPGGGTITAAGGNYAAWAGAWFQWEASFPAVINPGADATGAACGLGQAGGTFFLAPSYVGATVTRDCTIVEGTSIFVPVIAVDCSTAEAAPFNGTDASSLSSCAKTNADAITAAHLAIDGTDVADLASYRVQSSVVSLVLPQGNMLNATPGAASAVVDGVFINIEGMNVGDHTIEYGGTYQSGGAIDITYKLHIVHAPVEAS